MVIVDDINLPLGAMRLEEGSHGGHNGLKSIIEYIGPISEAAHRDRPSAQRSGSEGICPGEFFCSGRKVLKT